MNKILNLLIILIIQLIIIGVIYILKKILKFNKIPLIDLLPPFLLYFIYQLTLNSHDYSIMPYIVIIWMLIGIGLTLYEFHSKKDIFFKTFYKRFWRIGDALLFLSWIFSIIWGFIILM